MIRSKQKSNLTFLNTQTAKKSLDLKRTCSDTFSTSRAFHILHPSNIIRMYLNVLTRYLCTSIMFLFVFLCRVFGKTKIIVKFVYTIYKVLFFFFFNYNGFVFICSVQAALAPVALDIARNLGTPEDVECATRLVTIAVISILLTAPIGAFGIQLFGPRLLPKSN